MKKKIAFIWPWPRAAEIFPNWRDGLRAAIEEIEKSHEVEWLIDYKIPEKDDNYSAILFWDDSESIVFGHLNRYSTAKKGIFLTTDPKNFGNLRMLDAVFCESQPVLDAVNHGGAKGVFAFGTDTNFYKPNLEAKKDIEYFYPATFSPWKRQSDIAHLGNRLLCLGTIQPDGYAELEACEKTGVQRKLGYFPAEEIRGYYERAQKVIIPAVHGSERTVLEAMSMNILPEVTNSENIRTRSYVEEFNQGDWKSPREYVLEKFSPTTYARNILKGLGL